jgi:hypothetical protein
MTVFKEGMEAVLKTWPLRREDSRHEYGIAQTGNFENPINFESTNERPTTRPRMLQGLFSRANESPL